VEIRKSESLTMRLRPPRLRREGQTTGALRLRQVSARFAGTRRRIGSGPPARVGFLGFSPTALQQSVVKVRYVPNRGGSGWRGHGKYLAREGAQQEGRPGQGFDASESEIDIADRLSGWQREGDPRLWKLIVSPEAGERLNLRQHARELVAAMEGDLGVRLDWVGIEHFDTAHPHIHLAIRGRSQEGVVFRMPKEYVGRGIRQRSQELATQTLGLRHERDRVAARERGVSARHFGVLDQLLERRADASRRIEFEPNIPSAAASQTLRLQLLQRLEFLGTLGLAQRVGKRVFELSEHHRAALEQMQLARDLQRSLTRYGELLVDPDAPMQFTELRPGVEIRGRVVSGAEDEARGESLLLVEGTDGAVHVVAQTPKILDHRERGELGRGEIVTFRATEAPPGGPRAVAVEITRHGRLSELEAAAEPSTLLDLTALQMVQEDGREIPSDASLRGFAGHFREASARRLPLLEKRGLVAGVEEERGGERVRRLAVMPGAEETIERAMKERDRGLTPLIEVERSQGKPVTEAKLEPGRAYRGRVVAMASDAEGRTVVVLQSERTLTALPAPDQKFQVGQEIRARAVAQEVPNEHRRVLAWQLDELDREQKRDRGRER